MFGICGGSREMQGGNAREVLKLEERTRERKGAEGGFSKSIFPFLFVAVL